MISIFEARRRWLEEQRRRLDTANRLLREIFVDPRKKQFPWMFDENGKMKGKD